LGVLEKTFPYLEASDPATGRIVIQMGFRVTDLDAVRRAGFVNASGAVNFRWIQVLETNRPLQGPPTGATVTLVRRYRRYVDPNSSLRDNHPYYWDEEGEGDPTLRNARFSNVQAHNGLCYDLIFEDSPGRPLREASPGRRVYWNAETALVGVRPGHRNVILNTFHWGFDIVVERGTPSVRFNALQAGRYGGSPAFRQVLSRAIRSGQFPGHCFVGPGYAGTASCR
jgi:hypothetical protein